MANVHLASFVGMVFFYLLVLAVGLWASRRKESNRSTSDLFLAGRNLPLLVGIFTMTATWVGGGYINGTAEAVYQRGALWCQAPWGYALSLALGGLFFARPMRDAGYTTLLGPFAWRYGDRTSAVLFVPALVGELFWSAAILTALGTTFSTILGLDFSSSVLLSAAIAIAYTFTGGLWSVAYTDVAQLLLIIFGLGLAVPFALSHAGGWDDVVVSYRQQFDHAASFLPSLAAFRGQGPMGREIWVWVDTGLLLICGGIPWGVYFQRVLSCPSGQRARQLSLLAAVGCLLMAVPPAMMGAIAASVDWSTTAAPHAPEGAMVLPFVLQYLTTPAVAIVGLGAVAAAVMSSVDSSVLSVSSMFAWNVYRPLIRPQAGDRDLVRATKGSILLFGALATVLALSIKSVYALWFLCADLVYVILFPQLVMVLYLRQATKAGALAGVAVGAFLRLGGGEAVLGIPAFLPYPWPDAELGTLFPFRTTAMVASLVTIYVVSRLTAPGPGRPGSISRNRQRH
jgi:high affinity choline transporter 7